MRVVDVAPADVPAVLDEAVTHRFDLAAELPFRASLLRCSEEEHVLVLVVHHIASDGGSSAPMMGDPSSPPTPPAGDGRAPAWEPLPIQYRGLRGVAARGARRRGRPGQPRRRAGRVLAQGTVRGAAAAEPAAGPAPARRGELGRRHGWHRGGPRRGGRPAEAGHRTRHQHVDAHAGRARRAAEQDRRRRRRDDRLADRRPTPTKRSPT